MNNFKKVDTPNFDRIDPRTCMNGKLRKLHRLINAAYMSNLKPFGIRGSMLSILFIIGKRPRVNQKTIAENLILDQSTMTRDLRKLEEKGWISKRRGADSRHKELILTDNGYQLLEEITPVWERMHHTVESILGQYNIQNIDQVMKAIQSNLDNIKNS